MFCMTNNISLVVSTNAPRVLYSHKVITTFYEVHLHFHTDQLISGFQRDAVNFRRRKLSYRGSAGIPFTENLKVMCARFPCIISYNFCPHCVLKKLYWLSIRARRSCRILIIIHIVLNDLAPCQTISLASWSHRSSTKNLLTVKKLA